MKWFDAIRARLAQRQRLKAFDAGFEYAFSVLKTETDSDVLRQIQEQADCDMSDPFCRGMQIAINGWATCKKAPQESPCS